MSLQFLWIFLPLLGGFIAHAPVLRWDLFRGLKRPLDGGRTFRGRRLFGDNKTWRGALTMSLGITLATLALAQWPAYWTQLPPPVQSTSPLFLGMLLALGTVLGELPNSWLKRQLGIAPGAQQRSGLGTLLSIYDQGDFVLGIWLALAPIWAMRPLQAVLAFVCVVSVHALLNIIGYIIGARKTLR